jgi:hypothetical protein
MVESSEETRAVRVGEKETSEYAAIVERYADLFTREQYDALAGSDDERVLRLREACGDGVVSLELATAYDELQNALLAARIEFRGEEMPLRNAQAQVALEDDYAAREELGRIAGDTSAGFNDARLDLMRRGEAFEADLTGEPDPVARSEKLKAIDLHELSAVLDRTSAAQTAAYGPLRERWLDRILGPGRDDQPSSYHIAYVRRMSPLAGVYTKERAVEVCLETLTKIGFDLAAESRIRLDLDDRPQKNPRACVIASDPPEVVHLITRAQGGIHDYQAFLHEAGHALHYAGCDPRLAYTFRRLSRDHALTEVYSFLVESITREPGWHAGYFDLDEETARTNAEATRFLEAILFRRYAAKLAYELELWGDFEHATDYSETYARRLLEATGVRYRADNYLDDLDEGFYSADYLRAWIRTAQVRSFLRAEVGEDWWARTETGDFLRTLFLQGTRPSSEDVAAQIGFDPLDTAPLLEELAAAA